MKTQRMTEVPGTSLRFPETLICGAPSVVRVTVTAGVHSREYVGIRAMAKLAQSIKEDDIRGSLRLIHALNYDGFIRRSADVFPADGKNLNRVFPGDKDGSETQRLAAFLESEVINTSDFIIDLHSGGFCEYLTPHVYFQSSASEEVCRASRELSSYVDVGYAVKSKTVNGFYGHAGRCGVPAILIERGGCGLWSEAEADAACADVLNILRFLGVLWDDTPAVKRSPRYLDGGVYLDAPVSGCWHPLKAVGESFVQGERLGELRDIYGELQDEVIADENGVLLYQTASLGIEKGTPMIAWGKL